MQSARTAARITSSRARLRRGTECQKPPSAHSLSPQPDRRYGHGAPPVHAPASQHPRLQLDALAPPWVAPRTAAHAGNRRHHRQPVRAWRTVAQPATAWPGNSRNAVVGRPTSCPTRQVRIDPVPRRHSRAYRFHRRIPLCPGQPASYAGQGRVAANGRAFRPAGADLACRWRVRWSIPVWHQAPSSNRQRWPNSASSARNASPYSVPAPNTARPSVGRHRHFAALADELAQRGYAIWLLGSPADRLAGDDIARLATVATPRNFCATLRYRKPSTSSPRPALSSAMIRA